jgi:ABC-type Zn uptake system ZnuABC Zn-binding protein ZnuA
MVGLGFDVWMERMLKDAAPSARVLKVGDRVPTLSVKEEAGGAVDPYVWLDPQRAMVMTKAIAEELARVDPGHAGGYRVRAEGVSDALHALDQEVEAQTKAFRTREFATFHGSFGYFADRYHLQIVAVIEPTLGSTPTSETIARASELVRAKHVTALFRDPPVDPRTADGVADAAHVPLGVLDPLGGDPVTDSYEKLIRFDVAALAKALR